jgi:hypothetical protein
MPSRPAFAALLLALAGGAVAFAACPPARATTAPAAIAFPCAEGAHPRTLHRLAEALPPAAERAPVAEPDGAASWPGLITIPFCAAPPPQHPLPASAAGGRASPAWPPLG